jgi:hypothetical protein
MGPRPIRSSVCAQWLRDEECRDQRVKSPSQEQRSRSARLARGPFVARIKDRRGSRFQWGLGSSPIDGEPGPVAIFVTFSRAAGENVFCPAVKLSNGLQVPKRTTTLIAPALRHHTPFSSTRGRVVDHDKLSRSPSRCARRRSNRTFYRPLCPRVLNG